MKKTKNAIIISACAVVFIALACGIVFFALNRIPSKYHGTYTRYTYSDGEESKETYKISALSVRYIFKWIEEGEEKKNEFKFKYRKKGEDIIISFGEFEQYLIVEEDCLYVETSKDISGSKKYGWFFWNEKSEKADIYEIENKGERDKELLRKTMETWAQKLVYNEYNNGETEGVDPNSLFFYMRKSEEEPDKTDLNTYKIEFNVLFGSLSLCYDKKTKEIDRISFSGAESKYAQEGNRLQTRALLLSCMYVLGNEMNIKLNQEDRTETLYRYKILTQYEKLLGNEDIETYWTEYTLNNDRYDISYSCGEYINDFSIFLK